MSPCGRSRGGRLVAQRIEAHRHDSAAGRSDDPGGTYGEIEPTATYIGTSVRDRDDDVPSVAQVGHADLGAELPRSMGGGEIALVEDASACGASAVEPRAVVRGTRGDGWWTGECGGCREDEHERKSKPGHDDVDNPP